MKSFFYTLAACVLLAAPGHSQVVADNVPVSKEGREVFAAITRWADAVRDRDAKALEALFEENLIVTTADGKTRGKAEELAAVGPASKMRFVSIKNDDVMVRVFGQTAVATAICRMQFAGAGGKNVQMSFRYTALFVNKDNRWQIVALQTTQPIQS